MKYNRDEIIYLHIICGYMQNDIAKHYGISRSTLCNQMQKFGIKVQHKTLPFLCDCGERDPKKFGNYKGRMYSKNHRTCLKCRLGKKKPRGKNHAVKVLLGGVGNIYPKKFANQVRYCKRKEELIL